MRALVAQIEVSEQAMGDTQQAVQDAIAQVAPTGSPTAEDQAELDRLLMAAAANGLLEVTRGGDLVASVQTLPWHADVRQARGRAGPTTGHGRPTSLRRPRTLHSSP